MGVGREFVHVCFGLLARLVQVGANLDGFGAPWDTDFEGLCDLWTDNRGAPKTPNPTTMDPTPHSRPSGLLAKRNLSRQTS